ncbi:STAS domain-containing protein [Streptomyces sp. NPDC046237]|uniref:STAS domain-containing protein n=1 Tax=Streptomyces sp. NPDC046237 TaxID=3154914 RepID=UPI0033C057D3
MLRVVADMSGVTFPDSTGINVLLIVHQQVREAQAWLRIAAPTDNVQRVLTLIGVDAVIPCHPTLEAAMSI